MFDADGSLFALVSQGLSLKLEPITADDSGGLVVDCAEGVAGGNLAVDGCSNIDFKSFTLLLIFQLAMSSCHCHLGTAGPLSSWSLLAPLVPLSILTDRPGFMFLLGVAVVVVDDVDENLKSCELRPPVVGGRALLVGRPSVLDEPIFDESIKTFNSVKDVCNSRAALLKRSAKFDVLTPRPLGRSTTLDEDGGDCSLGSRRKGLLCKVALTCFGRLGPSETVRLGGAPRPAPRPLDSVALSFIVFCQYSKGFTNGSPVLSSGCC